MKHATQHQLNKFLMEPTKNNTLDELVNQNMGDIGEVYPYTFLRVPGGWIATADYHTYSTSVFVPFTTQL